MWEGGQKERQIKDFLHCCYDRSFVLKKCHKTLGEKKESSSIFFFFSLLDDSISLISNLAELYLALTHDLRSSFVLS